MKLKVDSAGRLVVPKSIRARLGFEPGVEFEAVEKAEGLLLCRVANETRIARDGALFVYNGRTAGDVSRGLEADRDQRIREIWGS